MSMATASTAPICSGVSGRPEPVQAALFAVLGHVQHAAPARALGRARKKHVSVLPRLQSITLD